MRRENSAIISGGKPSGNTGNGRSSTMPIISQWPVTESLPADASAIRPIAARGTVGRRAPPMRRDAAEAERAQRRQRERHPAGDVAERVAALDRRTTAGVRQLADADAVEDDDDGAGERRAHVLTRHYWWEK